MVQDDDETELAALTAEAHTHAERLREIAERYEAVTGADGVSGELSPIFRAARAMRAEEAAAAISMKEFLEASPDEAAERWSLGELAAIFDRYGGHTFESSELMRTFGKNATRLARAWGYEITHPSIDVAGRLTVADARPGCSYFRVVNKHNHKRGLGSPPLTLATGLRLVS
ncbi:MAG: hypothetical protein AAFR76_03600 [Planctomycetota bacterium]